MIAIVDYGLGNVKAFANVYNRLNVQAAIVRDAKAFDSATKIILPGVGAFDFAMNCLNKSGMREKLEQCVLQYEIPVLGVCVGMQMMAQASEEGSTPGLGWIGGKVKKFQKAQIQGRPRPHMGWNTVIPNNSVGLFLDINQLERFYFLHSYYFACSDDRDVLAFSQYGSKFVSAFKRGNIYGVQCHPEKSHQAGVRLLKNFGAI